MNRSPMEIDIWNSDWGLASVDLECLRLVTFCKFADAKVKLNIKYHTWTTPKGRLPVFRHGKKVFLSFEEVSNYLLSKNLTPDHGIPQVHKADIVAFTSYLREHLYPALIYTWWLDDRNRINVTNKWYAKNMSFPFNLFYPNQCHQAAQEHIEAVFPHIENQQELETEIHEKALECINALSQRLGSQEYMFGAHPISIDATAYAYLALILKTPFPSNKLKMQVHSCPNLVKYVNRISQRYFADELQAFKAEELRQQEAQLNRSSHPKSHMFLAGGFAAFAMAFYAYTTGLLPRN